MVSISCLDKAAGKADVTDRSSSILHVLDLCNKSLILTSSVVVSSWKSYTNIEWLSLSFIVFNGIAAYVIAFSPGKNLLSSIKISIFTSVCILVIGR